VAVSVEARGVMLYRNKAAVVSHPVTEAQTPSKASSPPQMSGSRNSKFAIQNKFLHGDR
jgi:hypothetical protein